jgi:Rad52/22 family double-strand break repair protein
MSGSIVTLPCASLAEALPQLRRPPSAEAVRFKIQTVEDDAGQVASYVDARLVYDRLDLVCGERWWPRCDALSEPFLPMPVGRGAGREPPLLWVRCRLTLFGVTREDVGAGEDPKAAVSDAVKRAAVHFGVGRSLYAMRLPWLREGGADGELRRNGSGELIIDRRSETWCRDMYERWLEARGQAQFGAVLDHDAAGPGRGDGGEPAARSTAPAAARTNGSVGTAGNTGRQTT